ncbi:hypothetical protein FTUN_0461 [Frigoriglobus tundricola]|uniref:Uncharacterized protein n=1 Tax=Frigoriglobus tundricola TaxID=2774151 RepID=A0A6M5YI89_9BACT|nr:hypothetical protein FTUN_0461 [Frigoriglobus tundricola]
MTKQVVCLRAWNAFHEDHGGRTREAAATVSDACWSYSRRW